MTPVERPPEPAFLAERCARWSESFVRRRAKDPACEFDWHEVDGVPVNQLLMAHLRRMTAGHCAYCDHFELGEGSRETIDHVRPKSASPELAYAWENLFPACDQCQQVKGERFDDALLRPDDARYRFERFFVFNSRTGALDPNPQASDEDQRRASVTIKLLGLNSPIRANARRRWFRDRFAPSRWAKGRALHQLPYRFLAPAALPK